MGMQDVPAKAEEENEEKGVEETMLEVNTEGFPGNTRLYSAIGFLSALCLILLMAVVILGVKRDACPDCFTSSTEANPGDHADLGVLRTSPSPTTSTTTIFVEGAGSEKCPKNWVPYRNYCFFLSTLRKTWDQSHSWCTSFSGSLAVITSQDVQNLLTKKANLMYWIGLKKHQSAWQWVNNQTLEKSYWRGNPGGGDCVLLSGSDPPETNWISGSCSSASYFICQLE